MFKSKKSKIQKKIQDIEKPNCITKHNHIFSVLTKINSQITHNKHHVASIMNRNT